MHHACASRAIEAASVSDPTRCLPMVGGDVAAVMYTGFGFGALDDGGFGGLQACKRKDWRVLRWGCG